MNHLFPLIYLAIVVLLLTILTLGIIYHIFINCSRAIKFHSLNLKQAIKNNDIFFLIFYYFYNNQLDKSLIYSYYFLEENTSQETSELISIYKLMSFIYQEANEWKLAKSCNDSSISIDKSKYMAMGNREKSKALNKITP